MIAALIYTICVYTHTICLDVLVYSYMHVIEFVFAEHQQNFKIHHWAVALI